MGAAAKTLKILVVDDFAVVRSGLRQILQLEWPGALIAEAGDPATALAEALRESWDLVLVDISLPGRSGLDLLQDLRKARPGLRCLVLSMYPEEQFALRALRAGAVGYLTKSSAADEVTDAVRQVLAGGRYVSAGLAQRMAGLLAGERTEAPHETLSDREMQTLQRLAAGRAIKEIAAELSLSEKTVSTYRTRLLEKLGLQSNAELARYAVEHGLVE
jgi:DNA-binding NarL/FixJ family response regulator